MATTLHGATATIRTMPSTPHYRAMKLNHIPGSALSFQRTTVNSATELDLYDADIPVQPTTTPTGWYSEVVTAEVTISGAITVNPKGQANALSNTTLRAYLWKETGGGSAIRTLIGVGDSTTALASTQANIPITITPSAPITVGPGEQFVLRVTVIPRAGMAMVGGYGVWVWYGGTSGSDTTVVFTETISLEADPSTYFFLRRDDAPISGFMNLLTTRGVAAATTAVVATAAGGTEIQVTKTSGGVVAQWVTERFRKIWRLPDINGFQSLSVNMRVFAAESNTAANCSWRIKLFRLALDGTETEAWVRSSTGEFSTSMIVRSITHSSPTPFYFYPDDRMILRLYIIPVGGTMAGGHTCTFQYDEPTSEGYIRFYSTIQVKDESEPNDPPPPQLMMTGMGS